MICRLKMLELSYNFLRPINSNNYHEWAHHSSLLARPCLIKTNQRQWVPPTLVEELPEKTAMELPLNA